jgi:chromosome segregation ATPase
VVAAGVRDPTDRERRHGSSNEAREGEGRSAPSGGSGAGSQESWPYVVDDQPELRLARAADGPDEVAGARDAFDEAPELLERQQRFEELERDLKAALHARVELETRVRDRERRLGELESELEAVRNELDQARRREDQADGRLDADECGDDFLAVGGRAKSHLAARRAQLRERDEQLLRHAARVQA